MPPEVCCPITHQVMEDPVVAADGHSYERDSIVRWMRDHTTSPLTNEPLFSEYLFSNITLRNLISVLWRSAPELLAREQSDRLQALLTENAQR